MNKLNKFSKIAPFIVFALIFIDLGLIFFYAPEESGQGLIQKIFYFHVSSAFSMYIGFILSGFAATVYIFKKTSFWNSLSHAGASVGLLFCSMVLISGPIWAKPIWGAWWTWDPRLTTTLIIWLVFFATILLRNFYGSDHRGRIYASILTLFGLLDIPLIIFAVKIWRGIHPAVLGKKNNMPIEMKITMFFTMFTVFSLIGLILWIKTRQLQLEDKYNEFQSHMSDERME